MRVTRTILALAGILVALSGCITVANDGPAPAAYIQQSLTGRTWLWEAGGVGAGIYFGPNGEGALNWNGRTNKIKWTATDGKFCFTGSGSGCWLLYISGGTLYSRSATGGSPYPWNPVSATRPGNRLL